MVKNDKIFISQILSEQDFIISRLHLYSDRFLAEINQDKNFVKQKPGFYKKVETYTHDYIKVMEENYQRLIDAYQAGQLDPVETLSEFSLKTEHWLTGFAGELRQFCVKREITLTNPLTGLLDEIQTLNIKPEEKNTIINRLSEQQKLAQIFCRPQTTNFDLLNTLLKSGQPNPVTFFTETDFATQFQQNLPNMIKESLKANPKFVSEKPKNHVLRVVKEVASTESYQTFLKNMVDSQYDLASRTFTHPENFFPQCKKIVNGWIVDYAMDHRVDIANMAIDIINNK